MQPERSGTAEAAGPSSRWVDISIESEFGCAVERTGSVYCWGRDPSADMGLRELPTDAPVTTGYDSRKWGPASRVELVHDARAVSTANGLACAIVEDGRVRCWGAFRWGTQHVYDVPGIADAVALEIGDSESCATLANRELWCWSADDFGIPTRRLDDVISVSVGDAIACGLTSSGDVGCWGQAVEDWHRYDTQFNQGQAPSPAPPGIGPAPIDDAVFPDSMEIGRFRGALGIALTGWNTLCVVRGDQKPTCSRRDLFATLRREDLDMQPIDGARGIAALAPTRTHVCARTIDEHASCWGRNVYGQLGDGGSTTREEAAVVPNLDGVLAIAVAEDLSCAVTRDDRIACWGFDRGEALAREPIHVNTVEGLRASSIAAAGHLSCAVDQTHELRCWGAESIDSVGIAGAAAPSPVGFGSTAELSALTSNWETCVLLADGALRCGTWASYGPAHSNFTVTLSETDVVALANGQPPSCTIDKGGDKGTAKPLLRCGQSFALRSPEPAITRPLAISAANMRGCVAHGAGKVSCFAEFYAWGDVVQPARKFEVIPGVDDAVELSSALYHDCARTKAGRVQCWVGRTETQWSADGRTPISTHYQMSNLVDLGLDQVTQLVSGSQFHCALRKTGEVRCWDDNPYVEQTSWREVPELGPDIVEIAAGTEHSCARNQAGEVRCWGDDVWGQLGRVPSRVYLTPTTLPVD